MRTYGADLEFVLKCGLAYKRGADEENVAVPSSISLEMAVMK